MLNESEITRLKEWSNKFFKEDRDSVTFDVTSEIDNSLTYQENQAQLRKKISVILPIYTEKSVRALKKKEAEVISKEEHENLVNTEIQKFEKQAELELDKALERIKSTPTTQTIEDLYFAPKSYAKMVARGNSRGLILYGDCGIGKSFTIRRAFAEENRKFAYLSGHVTSLELYTFLLQNSKENIVLDDVNVLNSEINLNMFKSALNEDGIVQYHTSSPRLKVPSSFVFRGTISLLLNEKPKNNENLKAVESRILTYELNFSYADKLMIIQELAKQNYKGLKLDEKNKIVEWIRKNTSKATKNLSLRTLFMLYEFYRYDKDNWEKLAEKIIVNDKEIELIIQGKSWKEWVEETGRSKNTYYRLKEKL